MTLYYDVQSKNLGKWSTLSSGHFVVGEKDGQFPTDTDAREAAVNYADGMLGGLPIRVVRVEAEIVHTAGGDPGAG